MTQIIAEFHYWDYGEYNRTSMETRPKIGVEELKEIAQGFNVQVDVKKVSTAYFVPNRIGGRLPHYDRVVVQVVGEGEEEVKTCVGRIFLSYGRPDEVPYTLFGGKRVGRKIIEALLSEFKQRKGYPRV